MTTVSRIDNPKFPELHIETGYENSNPADPARIQVAPDGRFMLRQHLEPNAPPGYSFHLNVAFVNAGKTALGVPLRIEWGEKQYDWCRNHMYVGYDSGNDWQMIAADGHAGITDMELIVPPGRHLLCVTPIFTLADYRAFLAEFGAHELVETVEVGESHEGRRLACLRLGKTGAPKAVITTRAHGYETACAFCMRGWLRKLLAGPDAYRRLLERMELFIFPMINPDAVAAGNCCLAPTGVNFGRELALSSDRDRGAKALNDFILGLAPAFYMDMHNHTGGRLLDSFRSNSQDLVDAFNAVAPDESRFQKVWDNYAKTYVPGYLTWECTERFGTLRGLTEFPWYIRLPADMEAFGVRFFDALMPLVAERG
ncbi:MAG: hypothetical protein JXR37_03450 [Kiritimatiellae bacterium]|nr:hypothetical protein [Kiritimatiellia bacterium]